LSITPKYIVSEVQKILKETFPKSITVNIKIQKNLWNIKADATQIEQVLLNLCVNSRDAMPKGGSLKIDLENIFIDEQYAKLNINTKSGPYVLLSVSDTGTGMSQEVIDRIFEHFYTTKEFGKGTGLGLATANSIIKSHHGFINVYSEINNGTNFKIYLPAEESEQIYTEKPNESIPLGNGETILLIDDESSILQITKSTLEIFGYNVITAQEGTEAILIYTTNHHNINLVITDMMMPFMDGETTIRIIKKINSEAKIIAMSGIINNNFIQNEENVVFMQKPFTAEKLLNNINNLLNIIK
jgi:two-component system cell cycle sensor histidine kinase/response regulator CckA